ncbi:hypothetical protein [Mycobacterium canetti]|uniref:hypothetical protein n=1 Tax=Mycobacterium canetti TaxID=78331 RepID=UPI0002ED0E74|nr:hypothetical protein [Mycobacterium canetti]
MLLSVHPAGGTGFEVIRAAGRAGGSARDSDSYLRHGGGAEMTFDTLPPMRRTVTGGDLGTVAGLLGDSPWIFCRCGATQLTEDVADAIGEAVAEWYESGQNTTRPVIIGVSVT